jgi:N-acetylglucosaminyldiphosphoundecaprenol N-acetyl-beta-D-mannosaminyltransferase
MTAADMGQTVAGVLEKARQRRPGCVSSLAVHGVVTAALNPSFRAKVESFEILAPDGQPIRWWMNFRYHMAIRERVAGTDLMAALCHECSKQRVGIYLYGSTQAINDRLRERLLQQHSDLIVSGFEPSLFRPLSAAEDQALVARINRSAAGIVFLGLGCPLQEEFAYAHRDSILPVQVCVGAAFNFHAGDKTRAPHWMRHSGLEWLHRLMQEPRRLFKRYVHTNTLFVWLILREILSIRK